MKTFENVIGQKEVVRHGQLICNALAEGRRIPLQPVAFVGNAGLGKTMMAELFGEEMGRASGGEFSFVQINSATTLPGFINQWVDKIDGRKAIIFVDEAHALSKKMGNFLKPILETDRHEKIVKYEDYIFRCNPFEHFWIAATNEDGKDKALFGSTGRFQSLMFVPYSHEEKKAIMQLKAQRQDMKIDADALEYLANRVLPNGRAISQLVESDCLLLGKRIRLAEAKAIVKEHGYFPLGLKTVDIRTLQFVGTDTQGRQVAEIAAAVGGENPRTTGDRLQWLAGYGFIMTHAGKKMLTAAGKEYLAKLAEAQRKARSCA